MPPRANRVQVFIVMVLASAIMCTAVVYLAMKARRQAVPPVAPSAPSSTTTPATTSVTNSPKSEREEAGLVGPVKMVRERATDPAGKPVATTEVAAEYAMVFDAGGRIVEETVYNTRGAVEMTMITVAKGQVAKADPTAPEVMTYTRDAAGRRVLAVHTIGGEEDYRTEYTYDADGRLQRERSLAGTDVLEQVIFTYDPQGRMVGMTNLDGDGRFVSRLAISYDQAGRRAREDEYDADKATTPILSTRYTYDGQGNVATESVHGTDDKLTRRMVFTYRYDARGNWITKTLAQADPANGKAVTHLTVTRTIEYFEAAGGAATGGK